MLSKRSLLFPFFLLFAMTVNSVANIRYVVKKGDSLYTLSKRFGVSVEDIKRANNLKSSLINVGQKLIIPVSSTKGLTATREEKPERDNSFHIRYVVKKGDTLSEIAQSFGVSVAEIKRLNGITGNMIKEGMVIKIPGSTGKAISSSPSNEVFVSKRYVVQKGDSLYTIAKRFGTTVDEIKRANGLNHNRIKVGDVLILPGVEERLVTLDQNSLGGKEPLKNSPSWGSRYVVSKGDTLSGIGKRFGVSVDELKRANGLTGDSIRVGMELVIPGVFPASKSENSIGFKRYTVKKGDTLAVIARKFGVSVDSLKKANGLSGTFIKAGQSLVIPVKEDMVYGERGLSRADLDSRINEYDIRSAIISVAKRFLGAPYKFGGTSVLKGIDCSAFVNKVFSFFDVELPRTARDIYKVGKDVDRSELTMGDLVFFRTYAQYPSHVGIYIGDSEFIHASSRAKRVTIDSIDFPYYRKRFIGAKRIEISKGVFYDEFSKEYKGFERGG
ncbi:MAG: peptidoglycan endopeptidase LytF [Deltaproteobacteria bacterium]|nr:MAG: peptidoglycan endopeptidase LytF [Deltaproteobacteria bacterium]